MGKFVEVITELAIPGTLTYSIPDEQHIEVGMRVLVTVSNRRHIGIVASIHGIKPAYRTYPVKDIIDKDKPYVSKKEIALWEWVAAYYMCNVGSVYKIAMPLSIRTNEFSLPSERYLRPLIEPDKMMEVLDSMRRAPAQSKTLLKYMELSENFEDIVSRAELLKFTTSTHIKELVKKGILEVANLHQTLPPARLSSNYISKSGDIELLLSSNNTSEQDDDEQQLSSHRNDNEPQSSSNNTPGQDGNKQQLSSHRNDNEPQSSSNNTPGQDGNKQQLSSHRNDNEPQSSSNNTPEQDGNKQQLSSHRNDNEPQSSSNNTPEQDGNKQQLSSHLNDNEPQSSSNNTPEQDGNKQSIYSKIIEELTLKSTVLLHELGLFDKTNLFIRIAEDMIRQKQQILILTPDGFAAEILFEKLHNHFKGGVVAYHPNMSDSKRCLAFAQAASNEASVVVGSRGAVFVPMPALGMVIIDQEHDFAYKNSDSAPRLNVRDVALMKSAQSSAKTLLCSETPSVEGYYNATRGVWGLVETEQFDRNVSFKVLERGKELLSVYLRKNIEQTLQDGFQALVFQNRRGFSQWVECGTCSDVPSCPHCSVSLTYHKVDNSLRCHYCGHHQPFSETCANCGTPDMSFQGRGTERIEESLQHIFPEAKIERIDYDSTRGKGAFEQISASIATDCNIVVGTQMVIRGIDFSRVKAIGIVNADNMLSQSDFRTSERAHSLLTLLSNRIMNDGEVIIQTTKRLDQVIESVKNRDRADFYETELSQRRAANYPPSVRMIKLTLTHPDRKLLFDAATRFEGLLRPIFGTRISPPFEPTIDRKQDRYFLEFYLRIEREKSAIKAKELVTTAILSMKQYLSSLKIYADVDPL